MTHEIRRGSIVEFGKYFISNDKEREPLKWRVLAKEEDRALLVTEKGIDCKRYYNGFFTFTWESSSTRSWLNKTFFRTFFSAAERRRILTISVSNNGDNDRGCERYAFAKMLGIKTVSNDTEDKLFLLSVAEARKYFCNDDDRRCAATVFAKGKGVDVKSGDSMFGDWWLRSVGITGARAAYVNSDGGINCDGESTNHGKCLLRPALWLKL